MSDSPQERIVLKTRLRRRGIYLLPNLFTTAALFAGFYAIVQAMNGNFEYSATAIFIAMVLDGLDGRVARLTGTQSEFGAEYDSMSDMVSFGMAPALIIYEWALKDMGQWGWIIAFIYCACAALRLARFNTNINIVDKRFFQGLPSPAAAGLIAGLVWVTIDFGIQVDGVNIQFIAAGITLFAALTMVSNIPFYSGKEINLRRRVPFFTIFLLMLFFFVLIPSHPPLVLFSLFLCYALSGYAVKLWRFLGKNRNKKNIGEPPIS